MNKTIEVEAEKEEEVEEGEEGKAKAVEFKVTEFLDWVSNAFTQEMLSYYIAVNLLQPDKKTPVGVHMVDSLRGNFEGFYFKCTTCRRVIPATETSLYRFSRWRIHPRTIMGYGFLIVCLCEVCKNKLNRTGKIRTKFSAPHVKLTKKMDIAVINLQPPTEEERQKLEQELEEQQEQVEENDERKRSNRDSEEVGTTDRPDPDATS